MYIYIYISPLSLFSFFSSSLSLSLSFSYVHIYTHTHSLFLPQHHSFLSILFLSSCHTHARMHARMRASARAFAHTKTYIYFLLFLPYVVIYTCNSYIQHSQYESTRRIFATCRTIKMCVYIHGLRIEMDFLYARRQFFKRISSISAS